MDFDRDKAIARALSFVVPGWGHVYAGAVGKGITIFLLWSLVGWGLVGYWVYSVSLMAPAIALKALNPSAEIDAPPLGIIVVGCMVLLISWMVAITDVERHINN